MIAEAYPDGLEVNLSYRQEARPYLPQPTEIATDIQAQLADIGITANLDLQESTTFIDNTNAARCRSSARLGRRLPGSVELLRLPLRADGAAVRHRLPGHLRRHRRRSIGDRPGRPAHRLPAGQPAARRAHPDGADRLRRFGHRLPGGSAERPRQPADQRDPGGDVTGGRRPVRVRAERRAGRPVLPGRDRRRIRCVSASRSPSRCSPTRSAAPHRCRRWPRVGSPTTTSRCGRSTCVRA